MITDNYDRAGRPITREQWGRLWTEEYRRIGEWHGEGGIWCSTVWLGIDHGYGPGHDPVIFETMVFGPEGYPYQDAQMRYCTEEQAIEGHDRTVDDLEHGRRPWFFCCDDARCKYRISQTRKFPS